MLRLELPGQNVYLHKGSDYVEKQKFNFGQTNLFEEGIYLYTGYVLNNKPHIKGIIYRFHKNKYEIMYDGEMYDGQITGHGAYYLEGEVLRFLGTFNSKGLFEGQGIVYHDGIELCNGSYKNGLIQTGSYKFPDTDYTMIGNFTYENNKNTPLLTGQGVIKYLDGSSCVGNFKNSLLHGSGILYDTTGNLYGKLVIKLINQYYERKPATYHVVCHDGFIIRFNKYEYSDYTLEALSYLEEKIPEKIDQTLNLQDIYKKTDKEGNVSYVIIATKYPQTLIEL